MNLIIFLTGTIQQVLVHKFIILLNEGSNIWNLHLNLIYLQIPIVVMLFEKLIVF